MDKEIRTQAEEIIERAADEVSKQPRFQAVDPEKVFSSSYDWVKLADLEEPEYQPASRTRDIWLSQFWKREPHLAGVLNSIISIDTNRGWSLTGGRNQVLRYSKILHNWMAAPGSVGYRAGMASASLSYYTSDLGAIVEIGRDGKDGPVRGLYHVDPTRCKLTQYNDYPLRYMPQNGKIQRWRESDYMRMASMISTEEKYNGLGYCFVSRALELAKIMIAVYEHDKEMLGARAPRGILFLQGISEAQWRSAMTARKAELDAEGFKYFNAVAVLAGSGVTNVDGKLLALSQLPANFDLQKFTSMLMYGYALCAGYDPSEFYPVQFGSLGRGTEMEVQHQKATGKGGLNYILAFQEQISRDDILPDTLSFQFDQRDDVGEKLQAETAAAWVKVFQMMREAGLNVDGVGGISQAEMRQLMAEKGLIPREWTFAQEVSEATDLQETERMRLLSYPSVWRAIERYPDEPLVRYRFPQGKLDVLAERMDNLIHPRVWRMPLLSRKADENVLYKSGDVVITEDEVTRVIEEGRRRVGSEFAQLLDNEPLSDAEIEAFGDAVHE